MRQELSKLMREAVEKAREIQNEEGLSESEVEELVEQELAEHLEETKPEGSDIEE